MQRLLISALTLALFPTLALAAAGESTKTGSADKIAAILVFCVVTAFLAVFVLPKIFGLLRTRGDAIRDEIDAAEMARAQAKDALSEYQKSLSDAKAQAEREITAARAQAQVIAKELGNQAQADLAVMRDRAIKDIETAKRSAVGEVYDAATRQSAVIAERMLREQMTSADDEALREQALSTMSAR